MSRARILHPNPDVDEALRYGGALEREEARWADIMLRARVRSDRERAEVAAAARADHRWQVMRLVLLVVVLLGAVAASSLAR